MICRRFKSVVGFSPDKYQRRRLKKNWARHASVPLKRD